MIDRRVHNHDLDPSCPENMVDGGLTGECIIRAGSPDREFLIPKQMLDRLGKDFLNRINELNKENTMEQVKELKPFTFQVTVQATDLDDALLYLDRRNFNVNNLDEVKWVD